MGWGSFREDIVDRLAAAIDDLKSRLPNIERAGIDSSALRGWIARAEATLAEVREGLDLATDPMVRAVHDLAEAQRRNRQLQNDLERESAELSRLRDSERRTRAKLLTAEDDLKQTKEELKAAAKDKRRTERKVDEALKANPRGMYDAYSTPERIKQFKPGK